MNVHKHARLTVHGRQLLVGRVLDEGWQVKTAAQAAGVSERTGYKWLGRFRAGGAAALSDRKATPGRCPHRLAAERVAAISELRRGRLSGPKIARALGLPVSTVGAVLRRIGLGRLSALDERPPVIRYERQRPGELIHIDIKKLGRFERIGHRITGDRTGQSNSRGVGWEYVHVCIDDASRVAFSQVLPTERKESAVPFLKAAVAYYESLGVSVSRVMTDNGSCYKSFDFKQTCRDLRLRHIRTKPYTPKTNGKAERFIQTSLREWAYAKPYTSSNHRAAELPT